MLYVLFLIVIVTTVCNSFKCHLNIKLNDFPPFPNTWRICKAIFTDEIAMIHRCVAEGSEKGAIILVLINIMIFGRLIWCDEYFANPNNSHFDSFESPYSDETYNVKTVGCIIPSLNIQNSPKKKFIGRNTKLTKLCANYNTRLLGSNQTHIWIIKRNYQHYNINNNSIVVCCYKPFYRPPARELPRKVVDNNIPAIHYDGCIDFENSVEVKDEYIKVTCRNSKRTVYNQYFIFTPTKSFTIVREKPFNISTYRSKYNVIIMGIGSMSRQRFQRTMPNTVKLLKKYKAVELKGYNTVADNTFENMMAVLTGMDKWELKYSCLTDKNSTLDSCPFIWQKFKNEGYYTALVEDTSRFSMFNRAKTHFRDSPTDYYAHPFIHESESLDVRTNKNSVIKCMGDKYYSEVLLDYIHDVTTSLKNGKLFGVFWEKSMSHDHLNSPINMDNAYVRLIKNMKSTGYLNKTILILMSDYGIDIGDIKERRLPFVFILMPPSFIKQNKLAYQNLKWNTGRLTTPFDLHETLLNLIDMTDLSKEEILRRSTEFYTHDRGISLFQKTPLNRTCKMAGIDNTWCDCHTDVIVSSQSRKIADAVQFINYQTNEILKPYPQCIKLIVDEIITVKEMVPLYKRHTNFHIYNVIVRMTPGGGIFDTILRYYNKDWSIVDHMERLNAVDLRNFCVKNPLIKTFCYCK